MFMQSDDSLEALPLTMPAQLWCGLGDRKRQLFRRAQAILDCLIVEERLGISETCDRVGQPLTALLPAFRLLAVIGLISVESDASVSLRALPGEHIRVTGPDGKTRWMFVTCPVRREASRALLN